MNIIVNSQILAHELRSANKVAPAKAALPILSGVQLAAEGQQLQIYATDLEVGLQTKCPATVQMPGVAVLPAARLLAMVEQFPNADVTMMKDGQQIEIRCDAFHSRLQPFPPENFPTLPEVAGQSYPIDATGLRRLIECTRYAVAEKPGQYYLQGALLAMKDSLAALVATDGKRLALATMPKNGSGDMRVILPMKLLDMLAAQTEGGELTLTVGEKHLFFQFGERLLFSRQIEGKFPAYERIVPRDNHAKAKVNRYALAAALRRVELAADEANQTVAFSFSPGTLDLRASNAQIGHAEEQVPAEYEGDPLTITVQSKAVLDMIGVAAEMNVTMALKDGRTPMLLLDGGGEQHLAVVMPAVG